MHGKVFFTSIYYCCYDLNSRSSNLFCDGSDDCLFGEDEDRDVVEFWHQEMGIYLEEFPQHEGIFEGIETGESGAGTVGS